MEVKNIFAAVGLFISMGIWFFSKGEYAIESVVVAWVTLLLLSMIREYYDEDSQDGRSRSK